MLRPNHASTASFRDTMQELAGKRGAPNCPVKSVWGWEQDYPTANRTVPARQRTIWLIGHVSPSSCGSNAQVIRSSADPLVTKVVTGELAPTEGQVGDGKLMPPVAAPSQIRL